MPRLHPCADCPTLVPHGQRRCSVHAQQQERARPNSEIRKWYFRKRWKLLRIATLRKNPCCLECMNQGVITPATDVDHIVPHEGSELLFFDLTNLQGLCSSHHAMKTRRGE